MKAIGPAYPKTNHSAGQPSTTQCRVIPAKAGIQLTTSWLNASLHSHDSGKGRQNLGKPTKASFYPSPARQWAERVSGRLSNRLPPKHIEQAIECALPTSKSRMSHQNLAGTRKRNLSTAYNSQKFKDFPYVAIPTMPSINQGYDNAVHDTTSADLSHYHRSSSLYDRAVE